MMYFSDFDETLMFQPEWPIFTITLQTLVGHNDSKQAFPGGNPIKSIGFFS